MRQRHAAPVLLETRASPGLRWSVAPMAVDGRPRWVGELLDASGRGLARTGDLPTRAEVLRVIARALQVAHVEDCYRRIDDGIDGLTFLLGEPAGGVLLLGAAQPTTLDRERAIVALKGSARLSVPAEGESVAAGAG